ncbi:MAG: FHA domain-containing protein [Thermogemmata sp.]|nr:FHA domain-containing protein [Thermogemmata sp.]
MTDPILERFALACGARQPLVLRVDVAEGEKLAEGQIEMPFVLVGRDDACDVMLADPEMDPRHLWLQVLDGQVYAVDLGSRTGLRWSDGSQGSGWLELDRPLRVGPFVLRLQQPPAGGMQRSFSLHYQPLKSDPTLASRFSPTILEFRNGKRARDRWQVNRRLTLIGRAPECKIRLLADEVTSYHCGLVLTSDGLWVVDLSGRGVVVNDERMRIAPLEDGADLWIGRFCMGVHVGPRVNPIFVCATTFTVDGSSELEQKPITTRLQTTIEPQLSMSTEPGSIARSEKNEECLGRLASHSPKDAATLSSSHIMAETSLSVTDDEISQSILIAQSGSLMPPPLNQPTTLPATESHDITTAAGNARRETHLATLLHQMGELHYRMVALLQKSCMVLLQLTNRLDPDRQEKLQDSITALQQVSHVLEGLQADLLRLRDKILEEIHWSGLRPQPVPPTSSSQASTRDLNKATQ